MTGLPWRTGFGEVVFFFGGKKGWFCPRLDSLTANFFLKKREIVGGKGGLLAMYICGRRFFFDVHGLRRSVCVCVNRSACANMQCTDYSGD